MTHFDRMEKDAGRPSQGKTQEVVNDNRAGENKSRLLFLFGPLGIDGGRLENIANTYA